ncbi:EcsC family protein [Priestia megaterium]|nr:EcsC family protein [Priestia megaterium]
MNEYEQAVLAEATHWKFTLLKRPSPFQRASKQLQNNINKRIPDKVHQIMTESIKKMVKATLAGSNFTTKQKDTMNLSMEEKENQIHTLIKNYRKTAAFEGAGTGAGGLLLGAADFPLFLSIKMKCLFEISSTYGFDVKQKEERLYMLYIFHLAFCSDEHREHIFRTLEHWDAAKEDLITLDWKTFQQEYRDYIDLVKMMQLMPGIGAIVGAYANYHLLNHLTTVAMNVYRLRLLS